jgi:carbonic anhydrase
MLKTLSLLALVVAVPLHALALNDEQAGILEELQAGNAAYVAGVSVSRSQIGSAIRTSTATNGQQPKAIVLSCADSRVPVEHVFRQGVGDLFVVRLAGNVPMKLGGTVASVEYAIEHIGTPKVIVVLGHTKCGAVKSTLEVHEDPSLWSSLTPELQALVAEIDPAVTRAIAEKPAPDQLLTVAVEDNAELAARNLLERSPLVKEAVEKGEVALVVGLYDIATGKVKFHEFHE